MGRRRYRDYDEDEEDRPRRRRGGESRAPLIIAISCLLVGLLGGGGCLGYWLLAVRPQQQLQKKGEQLVGKWSGVVRTNPLTIMIFDFRADGTFTLSGNLDSGRFRASTDGIWKVVGSKGNTLRVRTTTEGRANSDMHFEFVSADSFQRTLEGRTITFNRLR